MRFLAYFVYFLYLCTIINEYVTQSKYKNMKHKTIETTEYICNLVKVGGNSCIDCLSTKLNFRFDETREIVELLHKHGYDVLTKNDQEFEEKLDSYNRVLELQSKKNG